MKINQKISSQGCEKVRRREKVRRDKMLKEKYQDLILLILTLSLLFIFILSMGA